MARSSAIRFNNREDRVGSARLNRSLGARSPPRDTKAKKKREGRVGSAPRLKRTLDARTPPREAKPLSAMNKALLSPQLPPRSRSNKQFFGNEFDLRAANDMAEPARGVLTPGELLRTSLLSPATRAHERHRALIGAKLPSRRVVRKQKRNRQRPSSRQVTPFPMHLNEDFRTIQPRKAFGLGDTSPKQMGGPTSSPPRTEGGRSKTPLVKFLQEEFQRPASRQRPPNQSLHLFAQRPGSRSTGAPRPRRQSFETFELDQKRSETPPPRLSPPLAPLAGQRFRSIDGDESESDSESLGETRAGLQNMAMEGGNSGFMSPPGVLRASPSVLSTSSGRDSANAIWMRRRPGTAFHQTSVPIESLSSSPDHSPDSVQPAAPSLRPVAALGTVNLQRPQTHARPMRLRPPSSAGRRPKRVGRPQHVSLLDSEDDEPLDTHPTFERARENSSDTEGLCNTSLTSAFLDLFGT